MKRWFYLVMILLIFSSIWWFSSKDSQISSSQSDDVIVTLRLMTEEEIAAQPDKASDYRFMIRKAAHFSMYLLLGSFIYLFLMTFTEAVGLTIPLAIVFTALLAGVDEYHQSFVPGRSMQVQDVLIDSSGALFGMLLLYMIFKIREKKKPLSRVYYFGR